MRAAVAASGAGEWAALGQTLLVPVRPVPGQSGPPPVLLWLLRVVPRPPDRLPMTPLLLQGSELVASNHLCSGFSRSRP